MINIKSKRDYLVALESVAMTDIVLNMFIFFFISFSLIYTLNPVKASKIDVRLPKASSALRLEGAERVVLTVTKDGKYFLNDIPVDKASMKEELGSKAGENPSVSILLQVDGSADFDSVAYVLDATNELGIGKVSVAAIKDISQHNRTK